MTSRTRAALVGVAVIALMSAGCGGSTKSDAGKRQSSSPPSETSTTAASPTTTAGRVISSPADLEPLLISDVPAGFVRQPDDVGDTGPSNLDKAASDDGADDARAFLQSHGFIAGYQRLWAAGLRNDASGNPDLDHADQIVVFLYAFRDSAGASAYMQRTLQGSQDAQPGQDMTRYEPTGIPGAVGFTGGNAKDGYGGIVLFAKGGILVQLNLVRHTPDGNRDLADKLARDQFARL